MVHEETIRAAWSVYPAKINVLEIGRPEDLPAWEVCGKDELHIGVIRGQSCDTVIVVKHRLRMDCSLTGRFETLPADNLGDLGVLPERSQVCGVCGDFSTRINKDGRCQDCTAKNIHQFSDGKITATMWPNTGEVGTVMMPLVSNVPVGHEGWVKVPCPECGRDCWRRPEQAELMERPGMKEACTECALRAQLQPGR